MAKTRAEASYLFKYLIITQVVVYLEAGAIPCLLDQLSVSLGMNATQQGALGGVVYFTLSAASPLCAYFLHRFNPRHVLGLSLLFNNMAVLVLALTPTGFPFSASLMIIARGLIGFTQAFPCVYTPLWVDEYAPREKVAGWMSYLQGSVPMGVMLGYFIGTVSNWIVPETFTLFECWRWPFVLQFIAMCPIMTAVFFVPEKHLVIRSEGGRSVASSLISAGSTEEAMDVVPAPPPIHSLIPLTKDHVEVADPTEEEKVPLTQEKKGSELIKSSSRDPLRRMTRSVSSTEHSGILGYLEEAMLLGTPLSRTYSARYDEEDVLLASASMFGSTSQRGLRQIHQNQQQHLLNSFEAEAAMPSSRRSFNGSMHSSFLENGSFDTDQPGSQRGTAPESLQPTSGNANTSYGAIDHHELNTLRSPRTVIEASILEEEFLEVYEHGSFSDGLKVLTEIPIFALIVFGLTAVYFVVTGVQYWSTIFMIKSLHASKYLVNSLFVFVSATGPIFGVFCGGWLIDHYGGYIGVEQRAKSLGICMILGITAFIIAAFTTFFNDIYITATFLWLLLFFGGSILPACTGIFISVVPAQHRPLASSLSVMIFNLFGYALSPYLTGLVMEWVLSHRGVPGSYFETCDEACAYCIGFRFCLFWSVWSFVCISSAWLLARREAANARNALQLYAPKHLFDS